MLATNFFASLSAGTVKPYKAAANVAPKPVLPTDMVRDTIYILACFV
jgi:hypothetical protein